MSLLDQLDVEYEERKSAQTLGLNFIEPDKKDLINNKFIKSETEIQDPDEI